MEENTERIADPTMKPATFQREFIKLKGKSVLSQLCFVDIILPSVPNNITSVILAMKVTRAS
jgi:hypothetical protein